MSLVVVLYCWRKGSRRARGTAYPGSPEIAVKTELDWLFGTIHWDRGTTFAQPVTSM